MSKELGVTVGKEEDMAEWYQQVVLKAEFADYTPVKGCIVVRHWGQAIWEAIRDFWDAEMKGHGVKNHYFPLLIPEGLLRREAEHFEGFTPEVAWVTMAGEAELEERLAVRPTSETIMYEMFSRWIQSHRDLPLRVNQWCNVLRWETKMTKPFLRGREFLWHEAHTVHETEAEAMEEIRWAVEGYKRISEELLAMPVVMGRKTESDKFAGADVSYTIEGLMPDGKALQAGTSHELGQSFSRAFDITFLGEDGENHHPWQTSWGTSTRLLGGLLLLHGDDQGAVLPPRVAPVQVVIVPIKAEGSPKVLRVCREVQEELRGMGLRVELDEREGYTPGWKFNDWELRGVPLRLEIGPRDVADGSAVAVRRDTGDKEKLELDRLEELPALLETIQEDMLKRAKGLMESRTVRTRDLGELDRAIKEGKWAVVPHCGGGDCEESLADRVGGGPRVVPFEQEPLDGKCIGCDKKADYWLYWGRSY